MNSPHQSQARRLYSAFSAIITASVALLIIACDRNQSPSIASIASVVTTPTITSIPIANATDVLYMERVSGFTSGEIYALATEAPYKYAALLASGRDYEQRATEVAMNPYPTEPPGPPPTDTLGPPTPTTPLGMQPGCADIRYHIYLVANCWRGYFNGDIISVASVIDRFQAQGKGGPNAYPDRGVILVYPDPYLSLDTHPEVYTVPPELGPMRITTVTGTLVSLIQADYYRQPISGGETIIFDLATRQFITSSGTPTPSALSPTP